MVVASRLDGRGAQATAPFRVRKTIQSIKEIVESHTDADTYAGLKENNMDPKVTAPRVLNQDSFHEVKRKKDMKKDIGYNNMRAYNTGLKGSVDTRIRIVHKIQWERSQVTWDQNPKRGGHQRSTMPGINWEYRIVRDNRMNQKANAGVGPESLSNSASGNGHLISKSNVTEKNSTRILTDQKGSRNLEGQKSSQSLNGHCDSGPGHAKDMGSNGYCRSVFTEVPPVKISNPTAMEQRRVQKDSQVLLETLTSTNSVNGMSSSSSDPIHIPSPNSKAAGTVGAIGREVGVVGGQRQSSDHSTMNTSISSNSISKPLLGKDNAASTELSGHSRATIKSRQFSQTRPSESVVPNLSVSRPFPAGQFTSKHHQQAASYQKATQSNMEWKPKSSQKPSVLSTDFSEMTSVLSPCAESYVKQVEAAGLSEKLSRVSFCEDEHVVIPQHLQVSESQRSGLIFGSFSVGIDSTTGLTSALPTFGNTEELSNEPSRSVSMSVSADFFERRSSLNQADILDSQARASHSDSPSSAVERQFIPGTEKTFSPQDIGHSADVGFALNHNPSSSPPETQSQRTSSMQALRTQSANSTGLSIVTTLQQQTLVQHPHPASQLYPPVHVPHFPNFVPYRHVYSPVYVPPMTVPNYTSNSAFPHPSGMKYTTSQYKPDPAGSPNGYANFSSPFGFTINVPSTVGSTMGLEDMSRIGYEDSNLYATNPQVETSDFWIQTPRELPNLQSAPYYNLPGQAAAAQHAAYLPTQAGLGPFNANLEASHVQYPGLYHSSLPTSIAGPHHLAQQQVPGGPGGNVGAGLAASGTQVAAYQQPQLSWTANF